MNILDALRTGQWGGDPAHNTSMNQAALTLGASLLGSQGKTFGQALGGGLLGAQDVYGKRMDAHADTEYKRALAQSARQKAINDQYALQFDMQKWMQAQANRERAWTMINEMFGPGSGGSGGAPAPGMSRVPTDMPIEAMTPEQRALAGMGGTPPGVPAPPATAPLPSASEIGTVPQARPPAASPAPDANGIYRPQPAPRQPQQGGWQQRVNMLQFLALTETAAGNTEQAKRYQEAAEHLTRMNTPTAIGQHAFTPATGEMRHMPTYPAGFGPGGMLPGYRQALIAQGIDEKTIDTWFTEAYKEVPYFDANGVKREGPRWLVAPEEMPPNPAGLIDPTIAQRDAATRQQFAAVGGGSPGGAGRAQTEAPATIKKREEAAARRQKYVDNFFDKVIAPAQENADIARREIQAYQGMRNMLQHDPTLLDNADALNTGPLADWKLLLDQTLNMFGVAGDALKQKIGRMETMRAIANELQLNVQMLLKGQTSDRDMKTVEQAIPRITNSADGAAFMLDFMEINAELRRDKAKFLYRYGMNDVEDFPEAEDVWEIERARPENSIFLDPRMEPWVERGYIQLPNELRPYYEAAKAARARGAQ